MKRLASAGLLQLWMLCAALPAAGAADPAPAADGPQSAATSGADPDDAPEVEKDDPWQRLTEREDKRRPLEPFHVDVAGRPLTLGGEYELEIGALRRRALREGAREPDRVWLEQGVDLEAFYSFRRWLSFFTQVRLAMEEDLLTDSFEGVSDQYVERGEMWLYGEDIAGSHVNLDVGRLDFEDERRWWWDDELDAARIAYETARFEVTLAAAQELLPERSDERIDPERKDVFRLIGEAGWDWDESHSAELFVLYHDDHSRRERLDQEVASAREDDSDARLTWLGARAMGVFEVGSLGFLGYWLDAGGVFGEERLVDFEDVSRRRAVAAGVAHRSVGGWGCDVGASWIFDRPLEPRVFAGYAHGSGDGSAESRTDSAYRQTEIQANEAGFGGVERFPSYGLVLDPELSNLGIATLGAGLALLRSSSLDLVYHYYRLNEPAEELRDATLETVLDGEHRSLGHGVDLVLSLEEWERVELFFAAGAFRADRAFGSERGTWSFGGFFAARFAF